MGGEARVDEQAARRAIAALRVLTDLTPSGAAKAEPRIVPLDHIHWLKAGLDVVRETHLVQERSAMEQVVLGAGGLVEVPYEPVVKLPKKVGEELAAVQQVRAQPLSIGWLFLAGNETTVVDGKQVSRQYLTPLVTRQARVDKAMGGWQLTVYGDVRFAVEDGATAVADLERAFDEATAAGLLALDRVDESTMRLVPRMPMMSAFVGMLASALGRPGLALTPPAAPEALVRRDGLGIVFGVAVYADALPSVTSRASELGVWTDEMLRVPTAFHSVYAGLTSGSPDADEGDWGRSEDVVVLPLTVAQRAVVRRTADAPVTLLSGAPGTGKSHTLVAALSAALARGESVLVAAKTEAAVDALAALLVRQPGITPVLFGSSRERAALAARLAGGAVSPLPRSDIDVAAAALSTARRAVEASHTAAVGSLARAWAATPAGMQQLADARTVAPGHDGSDISGLVVAATADVTGWWRTRRRRRAMRRLRARVDALSAVDDSAVLAAIRLLDAVGAPSAESTEALCRRLVEAQDQTHRAAARWLGVHLRSPDRIDNDALAAVGVLTTALRSGRAARRAQLARLGDRSLTRALPLWIGTLGDVDDLLPPVPALFDLVVIDEASATEQHLAAPTLLRGRRAVIAGDPRQLRHVSFVSDQAIGEAHDRHRVDPAHRSQLDVRRNSVFDAATTAATVSELDEHFRSAPHLVDVVFRTLYDDAVTVATRSPVTHGLDCIHGRSVAGERSDDGVVQAEVDEVMRLLESMQGIARSVGVITPFRAQAQAIESAALARFGADDLIAMDLRVGTVHAFQGNERNTIITSLGLVDGDRGGWSFAGDPHLQAVMLTRARHDVTLVTSCSPDPATVLGRYVAAADSPPGAPRPVTPLDSWASVVADDLRHAGVELHVGYPTGRHVVDIATTVGRRPLAIVCSLHADGPEAHVERHVSLLRAGWDVADVLEGDVGDRRADVTVDLARRILTAR